MQQGEYCDKEQSVFWGLQSQLLLAWFEKLYHALADPVKLRTDPEEMTCETCFGEC